MRRIYWLCLTWLLVIAVPLAAQDACPALVEQALSAVGDNCGELDRNSACYGFDRVDSTFTTEQTDGFFSEPADRTELTELDSIQTYPLDQINNEYGAAVMNVQANVPESLPGQGVIFLLLGDTNVTNDVAADELASPTPAIAATTAGETRLFSQPTTTANVRETIAAGTTLNVDATVPGGTFIRVIFNEEVLWAERAAFVADAALEALPQVGGNVRTPMQAFYFTTGIGQPACNQAESTIAVQSPEGIEVNLTVNGVDINVGSMVTFTNDSMTVHRGGVTTSTGQEIDENETLDFQLDENGNIIGTGEVRDITDEEYERGQRVQGGINNVAEANDWETKTVAERDEVNEDGEIIHIVQVGESLFGIGTLYNASIPSIIQRNGLTPPDFVIFAGQRLIIPNPGSGFVGLPPRTDNVVPTTEATAIPTVSSVDCSAFARASGGTQFISDFAWTAAPGADEYKVNIYGVDGAPVRSYWVKAPATSLTVNMGDVPTGGSFQWEVEALLSGRSVCNSGRSQVLTKPADPNPPRQPPVVVNNFTASRTCIFTYDADVSWSGGGDLDTYVIFAKNLGSGADDSTTGSGAQGTVNVTTSSQIAYITITGSGGQSVTLPGC